MRGITSVTRFRPSHPGSIRQLGRLDLPFPRLTAPPKPTDAAGIVYPLVRGPYQNNGATPWYSQLSLGRPGQTLQMAFDTGSNFIWATSTLCGSGCQHYGGIEFDYTKSETFKWVDRTDRKVSFGPWGDMIVEIGSDDFGLSAGVGITTVFYLAKSYSGEQFAQLDWDGGIGLPSGTEYVDPNVSFVVADLMNLGLIDPEYPYVSFTSDGASMSGSCRIGGYDPSVFDPSSAIFMPWSAYTVYPGVEYIWSTALPQYFVGDVLIACNVMFCLDSGSSQFKGDDDIMNETLKLVSGPTPPDVRLRIGYTNDGEPGEIVIPPSVYMVEIQAGPSQGQVLPQFNPLGITELVLVGSVLMDLLYTIYEYRVTQTPSGYQLSPVGMWVFNKTGGPDLIRSRGTKPVRLGPRKRMHTM